MRLTCPPLAFCLLLLPLTACSKKAPPSATAAAGAAPAPVVGQKLDYNRDIQPILSNYCYHCHGPDTGSRQPRSKPLRLDIRDQALAYVNDKGVKTIVPGKPDASELVRRVESHDPDVMMPQDKEKLLSKAQIALLREWIKQGAEFRDHWAFEAPVKTAPPAVSNEAWCKTPIDRFILAKLDAEGLKPNAEADRRTLIRRVTLDLTGLLPTPAETEAFVADPADNDAAYAKVVDHLLASSAFGEHRAHYWLDLARYGDTHGIHVDAYRAIWPYRDYVINAFNADKPFDRFITEQLAGDLLPDATLDSIVASGFVRAGLASGEGGTVPQELWCNVKRERTEMFGVAFMGMTTGCAVCHDHKYDPLTTEDFYSLTAYFGNLTEKPYHDDRDDWAPFLVLPKTEDRAAFDAALAQKDKAQGELDALMEDSDAQVAAWLKTTDGPGTRVTAGLVSRLPLNEGAGTDIRDAVSGKAHKFEGAPPLWDEYPLLSGSFRLDNNTRFLLPEVGDFDTAQPFSIATWVRWNEEPLGQGSGSGSIVSRMDGANGLRGWELELAGGRIRLRLVNAWDQKAISVVSKPGIRRIQWAHVAATYDGSGKAAGVRLYINGEPVVLDIEKDTLAGSIHTQVPFNLGRRGGPDAGANPLRGVGLLDVRLYDRALAPAETAKLPTLDPLAEILAAKPDFLAAPDAKRDPAFKKTWTPFERGAARQAFFAQNEQARALRAAIAQAQTAMNALTGKVGVRHFQGANNPGESKNVSETLQLIYDGKAGAGTLVCEEKSTPAYAHVLTRGNYGARAKRVYARTPAFLPPPPQGAPANRLGLAEWVTMKDNPLTARVAVNRMWQELFGTGIVETSEDFGIIGDRPTHPKLLDWLAMDFRDGGGEAAQAWKIKRMYRQLALSMAYRQSATARPDAAEKDPRNRLYAHGPRFRMDAEELRDTALEVAGLLNREKIGGPSFLGYQPTGVWDNSYPSDSHLYYRHHGPMLYRRSVYQFVKRTAVHPELDIFDATDRLASCARRNRTNTPLAALALMNDVTFLEAARVLGQHALEHDGTTEAKLAFMFKRALDRAPAAEETAAFTARLAKIQAQLTVDDAKKLLAQGDAKAPENLDPKEAAAWMGLASIVLNSDEFLNK